MEHLDDYFLDFRRWLRLAEICAIRAELRARAGDLDGAMDDGVTETGSSPTRARR